MILQANQITLGYGGCQIISPTSLTIEAQKITCLIGPNGCGKSTLLRGLSGLLTPQSGYVKLDGKALNKWNYRHKARRMAVLSQNPIAPDNITVFQLVQHGRFPHQSTFGQASSEDREAVEWALKKTGMSEFRHRVFNSLSGGERQRGWIALTLAQQADILLVDEPTTFLDLGRQLEIMDLLFMLNRQFQTTIIMVLHDINQACRFSDRILAMHQGQLIADGSPKKVISNTLLERLFGIQTEVITRTDVGITYPFSIPIQSGRFQFS